MNILLEIKNWLVVSLILIACTISSFAVSFPSDEVLNEEDFRVLLDEYAENIQQVKESFLDDVRDNFILAYVLAHEAKKKEIYPAYRARLINNAYLALMGYGFDNRGIPPVSDQEYDLASMTAFEIGTVAQKPGGLEPTLSDPPALQRHWYAVNINLNAGVKFALEQAEDEKNQYPLPEEWTWSVPKTVFRTSMYYRNEQFDEKTTMYAKDQTGDLREVRIAYFLSMKDVARLLTPEGITEPGKIIYNSNLINQTDLTEPTDFTIADLSRGGHMFFVGRFSTKNHIETVLEWILNRVPEENKCTMMERVNAIQRKILCGRDITIFNDVRPDVLYLCTFYPLEDQIRFFNMIDAILDKRTDVTPQELRKLLFDTRHLSLDEKEAVFNGETSSTVSVSAAKTTIAPREVVSSATGILSAHAIATGGASSFAADEPAAIDDLAVMDGVTITRSNVGTKPRKINLAPSNETRRDAPPFFRSYPGKKMNLPPSNERKMTESFSDVPAATIPHPLERGARAGLVY